MFYSLLDRGLFLFPTSCFPFLITLQSFELQLEEKWIVEINGHSTNSLKVQGLQGSQNLDNCIFLCR